MQLQVELQKRKEIMYLEANKQKKEKKKNVPHNIFPRFEVRKKVQLIIWRLKDRIKGEFNVFSGYKRRNKIFPLSLECKLQHDSHGWIIFM